MKKIALLAVILFPGLLSCLTFTESFNSLANIDTANTTATVITSAGSQFVRLPLASVFTDLSTDAGTTFTTNVINIIGNGSGKWLLGGVLGKIVEYDGSTMTDKSATFYDIGTNPVASIVYQDPYFLFGTSTSSVTLPIVNRYRPSNGQYVNCDTFPSTNFGNKVYTIGSNSGYWLIGGLAGGPLGTLNKWDGTSVSANNCTDLTSALGCGAQTPLTMVFNGSYWLIGGTNGNFKKYDGASTFTDLGTPANFGASQIYTAGWNGSYWLIGGASGKLRRYDGLTDTATSFITLDTNFQAAGGGNFGANTISCINWNGSVWVIGGVGGRVTLYDGGTSAATSTNLGCFIPIGSNGGANTLTTTTTHGINSISWNGSYILLGGGTTGVSVALNRANALFDGAAEKTVASKTTIVTTTDRIYQATLTAVDQLNGQSLKYYVTADEGTHWQEVTNGTQANILYTGSKLAWKAALSGTFGTPKITALTINYNTVAANIMPANLGGIVTAVDAGTTLTIAPNTSAVDTDFTLLKDTNPPASTIDPTAALVAYDVSAKNTATGAAINSFSKGIALTVHWQATDGVHIDDTSNAVLLTEAKTRLCLAMWNGLHWIPISSSVVVVGNNVYVTSNTSHFSKYGIVIASPTNIPVTVEPNPFTPQSSNYTFNNVRFSFPNPDGSAVVIKIWDITGTLMKEISYDGAGTLQWDGLDTLGRVVESGVYIYEIKVGGSAKGTGTITVGR